LDEKEIGTLSGRFGPHPMNGLCLAIPCEGYNLLPIQVNFGGDGNCLGDSVLDEAAIACGARQSLRICRGDGSRKVDLIDHIFENPRLAVVVGSRQHLDAFDRHRLFLEHIGVLHHEARCCPRHEIA
jgi:hypothetical protein